MMATLYGNLLDDPQLPPGMQERIFEFAKRQGSNKLLATLARHPALDPALDERLGEIEAAQVRAAWMGRPGRSVEAAIARLGKEKRTSVLSALASITGLPDEVYLEVARRDLPKVGMQLLQNPEVPHEAALIAAGSIAANLKAGYRVATDVEGLLSQHPELVSAFAVRATSLGWLRTVCKLVPMGAELDEAAQAAVVDRYFEKAPEQWTTRYHHYNEESSHAQPDALAASVANFVSGTTLTATARASVERTLDLLDKQLRQTQAVNHYGARQGVQAVSAARTALAGATSARSMPPVVRARRATTLQQLADLAEQAVTNRDPILAQAIVCNSAADLPLVQRCAPLMHYYQARQVLRARPTEVEVVAAVLHHNTYLLSDEVLTSTGEPQRCLELLIRLLLAAKRPIPHNVWGSKHLTPELLTEVPLAALAQADLAPAVLHRIATTLLEFCSETPMMWEMVEGIGGEFEGSLEALLETCALVIEPVAQEESYPAGAVDLPEAQLPGECPSPAAAQAHPAQGVPAVAELLQLEF